MSTSSKNYLLSLLSGVILALAWPTYGFTFLIFFALIPLLFLERSIRKDACGCKGLRVWAYSYLTFLVWNIGTTWWLVNSTVFGMLFANFCNSLFYSLVISIFYWVKKRLPLRTSYIFLVCFWIAFEKFHSSWDLSWPWLKLGNVFSESVSWIQWYEYTGSFGGSLWVLIVNIGLYEAVKRTNFKTQRKILIRKTIPWLLGIAVPILISLLIYINFEDKEADVEVVLLQPNIDPYDTKYDLTNQDFLNEMISLSSSEVSSSTDYLLAPETYFAEGAGLQLKRFSQSELHKSLQEYLSEYKDLQLISGIQFYDLYQSSTLPTITANRYNDNIWVDYYNSAIAEQWNDSVQVYHKSQLVAGVENMPFKELLKPLLGSVMINLGGTIASRVTQKERSVFLHGSQNIYAAPIICYESIYGEFITDYVKLGANFLAIITNDAWWGNTQGYKQLLSYTRLRAVETRRDIARSANTGISAIVSARGNVISTLPYGQKGVLKGFVAKRTEMTFYVKYGDFIARWSIFISVLLFLVALSGRLKRLQI